MTGSYAEDHTAGDERRAARYDQLRATLQRLLSAAEDHEDDEFVADACEEARKALGMGVRG